MFESQTLTSKAFLQLKELEDREATEQLFAILNLHTRGKEIFEQYKSQ